MNLNCIWKRRMGESGWIECGLKEHVHFDRGAYCEMDVARWPEKVSQRN